MVVIMPLRLIWYLSCLGCQMNHGQLSLRFQAFVDAKHQGQIPLKGVFDFGKLLISEARIQVADGWGDGHAMTISLHVKLMKTP